MSSTIGQFDYTLTQMRDDDAMAFEAFVAIHVRHWHGTDGGTVPMLSRSLASAREIDEHIGRLKADLEAVGAQAKRALQQAQLRTRILASSKHAS